MTATARVITRRVFVTPRVFSATGICRLRGMPRAYQSGREIDMMPREMAQGLRELVGRAMVDPDFLVELQRSPSPLLAQYELSDAERATILQALVRLAKTPARQRLHEFRNALLRRVAT